MNVIINVHLTETKWNVSTAIHTESLADETLQCSALSQCRCSSWPGYWCRFRLWLHSFRGLRALSERKFQMQTGSDNSIGNSKDTGRRSVLLSAVTTDADRIRPSELRCTSVMRPSRQFPRGSSSLSNTTSPTDGTVSTTPRTD